MALDAVLEKGHAPTLCSSRQDQFWARRRACARRRQCREERPTIMAVHLSGLPAERHPSTHDVADRHYFLHGPVLLEAIRINDRYKVAEGECGSRDRALPALTLIELTVAEDDKAELFASQKATATGETEPDRQPLAK